MMMIITSLKFTFVKQKPPLEIAISNLQLKIIIALGKKNQCLFINVLLLSPTYIIKIFFWKLFSKLGQYKDNRYQLLYNVFTQPIYRMWYKVNFKAE